MIIYVAGASKNELWRQHVGTIEAVFRDLRGYSDTIYSTPRELEGSPQAIFSEVAQKIVESDGGIAFLTNDSAGPLIEAGFIAALRKPQAVIASDEILSSKLLRGLPYVVGFANIRRSGEVSELLYEFRETLRNRSLRE